VDKARHLRGIGLFLITLVVLLPVCFADELQLTYDANGNLISGDGYTRTYNSLNQLTRIENSTGSLLEEFVYHPTEERIYKKLVYNSAGEVKETIIYFTDTFVRVVNSSGTFDTTYIMHEGQKIAEVKYDGSKQFMHDDHLGSTGAITDSSGLVVEQTTYSPFGEIVSGGEMSRFDYEGKEFDSVVGDYDFNFRKYCVKWGIFCQPDTLIQNVYDPQSLNRYMFERGNPYKNVDEDGHVGVLAALGVLAVGAVVLAFSIVFLASELAKPLAAASISKDIRDENEYNQLYKEAKQQNPTLEEPYVKTVTGTERRYTVEELQKMKGGSSQPQFVNIPGHSNPYTTIMEQANKQEAVVSQQTQTTRTSAKRGSVFGSNNKAAIQDLVNASNPKNAGEKTAGQIIREWRERQRNK